VREGGVRFFGLVLVSSACMRYGQGTLPLAGVVAVPARHLPADRPATCAR